MMNNSVRIALLRWTIWHSIVGIGVALVLLAESFLYIDASFLGAPRSPISSGYMPFLPFIVSTAIIIGLTAAFSLIHLSRSLTRQLDPYAEKIVTASLSWISIAPPISVLLFRQWRITRYSLLAFVIVAFALWYLTSDVRYLLASAIGWVVGGEFIAPILLLLARKWW